MMLLANDMYRSANPLTLGHYVAAPSPQGSPLYVSHTLTSAYMPRPLPKGAGFGPL